MGPPSPNLFTIDKLYLGFWTNWHYGAIRGATLTLSRRDGAFLTAFLALFVALLGACFWRIVCFITHYTLSSEDFQDGIYHQHQAVLRNSGSPMSGFWSLLQIIRTWRKHGALRLRRIILFAVFALVTAVVFTIAGIFSSQISSSIDDEALLSGSACGFPNDKPEISQAGFFAIVKPYLSQQQLLGLDYVRRCYGSQSMPDCGQFVQGNLSRKSQIQRNASCPFPGGDKICINSYRNLHLDSGLLDSNTDLGLNTSPEHRFQIRRVTRCAPIRTEGYYTTQKSENHTEYFYNYGPMINSNFTLREGNFTYAYKQQHLLDGDIHSDAFNGPIRQLSVR